PEARGVMPWMNRENASIYVDRPAMRSRPVCGGRQTELNAQVLGLQCKARAPGRARFVVAAELAQDFSEAIPSLHRVGIRVERPAIADHRVDRPPRLLVFPAAGEPLPVIGANRVRARDVC